MVKIDIVLQTFSRTSNVPSEANKQWLIVSQLKLYQLRYWAVRTVVRLIFSVLRKLATESEARGAEVVVAFARVESLHRPGTPLLELITALPYRCDPASEHEVTSRTGDRYHAGSILTTYFVVADIGSARRDARGAVVVVAVTVVASVIRRVRSPLLFVC